MERVLMIEYSAGDKKALSIHDHPWEKPPVLWHMNIDGFVKSPTAALRFIFRYCGVL
jgi:hypothetical protein